MTKHDSLKTLVDEAGETIDIYRVATAATIYALTIHDVQGRRLVVVRAAGANGRDTTIARDTDPRIGERSLFEVAAEDWVGQTLEVAGLRIGVIESVRLEVRSGAGRPPRSRLPPPHGLSASPRIMPLGARGTLIASKLAVGPVRSVAAPAPRPAAPARSRTPSPQIALVDNVEHAAETLELVFRATRLFEDVAPSEQLRERLEHALTRCEEMVVILRGRSEKAQRRKR